MVFDCARSIDPSFTLPWARTSADNYHQSGYSFSLFHENISYMCYEQLFIQADFSNYFFNRGIPINESFETCLRAVQILPESFFP